MIRPSIEERTIAVQGAQLRSLALFLPDVVSKDRLLSFSLYRRALGIDSRKEAELDSQSLHRSLYKTLRLSARRAQHYKLGAILGDPWL